MSSRSMIAIAVLSAASLCAAPLVSAQEATVHQVYQAANAGNFAEAQALMDKVLQAHPNSGKAHYVEAELLAKQGKRSEAAAELSKAEKLAPGLPFAKPEAVQALRGFIANTPAAKPAPSTSLSPATPYAAAAAPLAQGSGIPWGMIIGLIALVAIVMFVVRKMAARKAAARYASSGMGPAGPMSGNPAYPTYGNAPVGPGMAPGGGIGSGIMGGLATGAAMGAGMVAGQALAHQFTGNRAENDSAGNQAAPATPAADPGFTPDPLALDDMGGNDFGLNDSGGWDDAGGGGGGGGDEWT